jgi:hypothetical protein
MAPDGSVYLVGWLPREIDFGGGPLVRDGEFNAFLAGFDANGAHLASRRWGIGDVRAAGVLLHSESVYITGTVHPDASLRLDPSGGAEGRHRIFVTALER